MLKEKEKAVVIYLRNGKVYAPEPLSKKNILIGGQTILSISDKDFSSLSSELNGIELDIEDMLVLPGFIDPHIHLTGGGGEGGPESRAPEAKISELIEAGITTAVGVLGTDSITRSLENLLAKTKALNNMGMTALMYTGAYRIPSPTLTGSIMRDLVLIQEVIGVKIALSDHRGSYPTTEELKRIASECRVGGMLSGKAGIVHIHMGKDPTMLNQLWEIINNTNIPITQFLPTHMTRTTELLEEAKRWLKEGGICDFTAGKNTAQALLELKESETPMNVTISTDAYGSAPRFSENGNLISIGIGSPNSLFEVFKELYTKFDWQIEEFLPFFTKNVAKSLLLKNKGSITQKYDADLLIVDDKFKIQYVISKGQIVKTPEWSLQGYYTFNNK
ncbi:MAG: beta-aspartyl-peptidase [Candidatus Heimdallarchaeaceae archaeon]